MQYPKVYRNQSRHSSDTALQIPSSTTKNIYAVVIFFFLSFSLHTFLMGFVNPGILFSKSQSVHTLVCLITHSFLIGLQPNLHQHFSYVCSTSEITFSLEYTPDCI